MNQLTTEETRRIVLDASVLRARYQYEDAIRLIQKNIESFDPNLKLKGYLEMFYSSRDGGDHEFAKKVAKLIAEDDPKLPPIQDYLKE